MFRQYSLTVNLRFCKHHVSLFFLLTSFTTMRFLITLRYIWFLCKIRCTVRLLTVFKLFPTLNSVVISFSTFPLLRFTNRNNLVSPRRDTFFGRPIRFAFKKLPRARKVFKIDLQVDSGTPNVLEISLILNPSSFNFTIISFLSGDNSFDFRPIFVYIPIQQLNLLQQTIFHTSLIRELLLISGVVSKLTFVLYWLDNVQFSMWRATTLAPRQPFSANTFGTTLYMETSPLPVKGFKI